MYKARTGSWRINIEPVEVEKVNDKTVWINGRRNARTSNYDNYFDTFEEAKSFLLTEAKSEINKYKTGLEAAEKEYERIQAIKLN